MNMGFIYDPYRCVDCRACIAACLLENGWDFQPRHIYKSESYSLSTLSLVNLSLACNHCENAACLLGCPSNAYTRDDFSGAVLIDQKKCLGCSYCKWNCPYDAPKSDPRNGLIGKCNLCQSSLNEGYIPACASGCPTGALQYDKIDITYQADWPEWFPGKKFDPRIRFKKSYKALSLKIVPGEPSQTGDHEPAKEEKTVSGEWSLIAFTFLITWSVGLTASSFITARLPDMTLFISLLASSGLFSLFHLQKKNRAWRALSNIYHSPLSREIAAWLLYGLFSLVALVSGKPGLILGASVSGFVLLFLIDMVYTVPDKRISFVLISGQTFMTGLLMTSFFAHLVIPFLFMALVKLASSSVSILTNYNRLTQPGLRIFRIALLIITGICLITGISYSYTAISIIFMTGELADRILFYHDFEPESITSVYQR